MFRYKLRTLLLVMAIGPPLLAGVWWMHQKNTERLRQQDFDNLIHLIQTTVKPESWDDVGGPGSADQFGESLSIVVGSGQTVHEQPADK